MCVTLATTRSICGTSECSKPLNQGCLLDQIRPVLVFEGDVKNVMVEIARMECMIAKHAVVCSVNQCFC